MIANIVLRDLSKQESNYGIGIMPLSRDVKQLEEVKSENFGLDGDGFKELYNLIKFRQIRIYCKENTTIHITSKDGNFGLIDYILSNGGCPAACGSYNILPDDNSYLSNHSEEFYSGTFGYCSPDASARKDRLYDHLMWRAGYNHIVLKYNRMECDDYKVKATGVWRYFVR